MASRSMVARGRHPVRAAVALAVGALAFVLLGGPSEPAGAVDRTVELAVDGHTEVATVVVTPETVRAGDLLHVDVTDRWVEPADPCGTVPTFDPSTSGAAVDLLKPGGGIGADVVDAADVVAGLRLTPVPNAYSTRVVPGCKVEIVLRVVGDVRLPGTDDLRSTGLRTGPVAIRPTFALLGAATAGAWPVVHFEEEPPADAVANPVRLVDDGPGDGSAAPGPAGTGPPGSRAGLRLIGTLLAAGLACAAATSRRPRVALPLVALVRLGLLAVVALDVRLGAIGPATAAAAAGLLLTVLPWRRVRGRRAQARGARLHGP